MRSKRRHFEMKQMKDTGLIMIFSMLFSFVMPFVLCGEGYDISHKSEKRRSVIVEDNTLKIKRTLKSEVETLDFDEATTGNLGTENEKRCICQSVGFRVAQLVSRYWEDGIFRSYEIKEMQCGWKSEGPYEFFGNGYYNGEAGDLGIDENKIFIDGIGETDSGNNLTTDNCWYKFTFIDGTKCDIRYVKEKDSFFEGDFLRLRNALKQGKEISMDDYMNERKKVAMSLRTLPFSDLSLNIFKK